MVPLCVWGNESGVIRMTRLSGDQIAFLEKQKIPLERAYDATGQSKTEYGQAMRDLEMEVAFGVTPCKKAAHTLRRRSGACVQCGPANFAFQRRYEERGTVYVAGSKDGKFIKVGLTSDLDTRERSLRAHRYGGSGDWDVIYAAEIDGAGRLERAIHRELADKLVEATYIRQGQEVSCYELLRCDVRDATSKLTALAEGKAKIVVDRLDACALLYAFQPTMSEPPQSAREGGQAQSAERATTLPNSPVETSIALKTDVATPGVLAMHRSEPECQGYGQMPGERGTSVTQLGNTEPLMEDAPKLSFVSRLPLVLLSAIVLAALGIFSLLKGAFVGPPRSDATPLGRRPPGGYRAHRR